MAVSTQDQDEMITSINITPMVDVMLVLLVIFMMAAPSLYQSAIKVDLPTAHSGEEAERITLKFTLLRDGKVLLDQKEISIQEVQSYIQKALSIDPKADALVAADRSLSHGEVMEFVDRIKTGGIQRFSVAVETPKK